MMMMLVSVAHFAQRAVQAARPNWVCVFAGSAWRQSGRCALPDATSLAFTSSRALSAHGADHSLNCAYLRWDHRRQAYRAVDLGLRRTHGLSALSGRLATSDLATRQPSGRIRMRQTPRDHGGDAGRPVSQKHRSAAAPRPEAGQRPRHSEPSDLRCAPDQNSPEPQSRTPVRQE